MLHLTEEKVLENASVETEYSTDYTAVFNQAVEKIETNELKGYYACKGGPGVTLLYTTDGRSLKPLALLEDGIVNPFPTDMDGSRMKTGMITLYAALTPA